jgi:acyl-CoA thioesterase
MHPIDAATALTQFEAGRFRGETHDAYWNVTGPFGGLTAATLLKAAMLHPKRQHLPLSATVNFCAPLTKGKFEIEVHEDRANRSTQFFSFRLIQDAATIITGSAVFAARPQTFEHQPHTMPEVKQPEAIEPMSRPTPLAWLSRYEFRFDRGAPKLRSRPDDPLGDARSNVWVRDRPERPLDFVSLMAMSDTFFARPFHVLGALVPFGTISISTYFHVDGDDLAAAGSDYLLGIAEAHILRKGFSNQVAELWSRGGKLLASSSQIVYFRDKK